MRSKALRKAAQLTTSWFRRLSRVSLKGWYWYQNGKLESFDFTSAVGADHVDENGILKLVCCMGRLDWGKVSYLPGIGGDNQTQEVVDER